MGSLPQYHIWTSCFSLISALSSMSEVDPTSVCPSAEREYLIPEPEATVRDPNKHAKINEVGRADDDDEAIRIATKQLRVELHKAVDESVSDHSYKNARKQLLDKVLACCVRMVGLHDEVLRLGNDIRDKNVVVRDLQAKIDWNNWRILDEQRQKDHNIEARDKLQLLVAEAENLGRVKDKQISQTNDKLNDQRGKNQKLQSIVQAAEKGNIAIRTTLETCKDQLADALD